MEAVLDLYAQPYNPKRPVICMDEPPVQLHREVRTPIAATAKHAKRVDYEYERAGTASIFMFTQPSAGWQEVSVRQRRTKIDELYLHIHVLLCQVADLLCQFNSFSGCSSVLMG